MAPCSCGRQVFDGLYRRAMEPIRAWRKKPCYETRERPEETDEASSRASRFLFEGNKSGLDRVVGADWDGRGREGASRNDGREETSREVRTGRDKDGVLSPKVLKSREAQMRPAWPPCCAPFSCKEYIGPIMAAPMARVTIRSSLLFRARLSPKGIERVLHVGNWNTFYPEIFSICKILEMVRESDRAVTKMNPH